MLSSTCFIGAALLASLLVVIVVLNIVNYVNDRRAYSEDMARIKRNNETTKRILGQLDAIRSSYPQYVALTLHSKTYAALIELKEMNPISMGEWLKRIDDALFETIARLKEDPMNVIRITAPMNHLINEIKNNRT